MKATANSWKTEPFESLVSIPYKRTFSNEEFQQLEYGLVPGAMEDKWFIYFEDRKLRIYRSWTGFGAYEVHLRDKEKSWDVESAFATSVMLLGGEESSVTMLDWLISYFLLNENVPYPF